MVQNRLPEASYNFSLVFPAPGPQKRENAAEWGNLGEGRRRSAPRVAKASCMLPSLTFPLICKFLSWRLIFHIGWHMDGHCCHCVLGVVSFIRSQEVGEDHSPQCIVKRIRALLEAGNGKKRDETMTGLQSRQSGNHWDELWWCTSVLWCSMQIQAHQEWKQAHWGLFNSSTSKIIIFDL